MEIDRSAGARHHVEDAEVVPTIWPFRVKWVEFVGEDRLEEWTTRLQEETGLEFAQRAKPGCATISGSGDGWDDCDYWGIGC